MPLLPTYHCFDDALEYIEARLRERPALAFETSLILVHGALAADTGAWYAHAWCEETGKVWDAGLLDGERVYFAVAIDEYYAARRVQDVTRYTVREAAIENQRSGHYGPWLARYRALCGASRKVMQTLHARARAPEEP